MNVKVNLTNKFQIDKVVHGSQFSLLTFVVASDICWFYLLQRVQQIEKHHCSGTGRKGRAGMHFFHGEEWPNYLYLDHDL